MPVKEKILNKCNAAMALLYLLTSDAMAAGGLPTINGPGGASVGSDPFTFFGVVAKWVITIIVYLLLALLFATVVKNAWQKYHQLGEEGSKVTWRDLGVNVIVGVAIIVLGIAFGNYAIDIFGKSTV
jgi:integrating conjugative element membrane protein (TIGR03745 family)